MPQNNQNDPSATTKSRIEARLADKKSDWSVFLHPVYLISAVLFGVNQLLERVFHLFIYPFNAYMDDLLALPLSLTPILWLYRLVYKKYGIRALGFWQCVGAALYFSVAFEVLAVKAKPAAFTADWLDVICYFVGALVFYFTINKRAALNS